MAKTILSLIFADIILLGIWLLWMQLTPDLAIIEVAVIPLLAAINGLLGIGAVLRKHRRLATGFILNILLSGIVFHVLLQSWYTYYDQSTYQSYTFTKGQQQFKIMLEKKGSSFDLSDVTNQPNGSTITLLMGDYTVRHDSIILREWNGPRKCLIYQRTLIGFEGSNVPIQLSVQE